MKKFNTTGPCFPDEHYMLPALDRLPGIRELVAGFEFANPIYKAYWDRCIDDRLFTNDKCHNCS